MTFREYALQYLENRGLVPDQAWAVVQEVINDPEMESMQGRWEYPIEGYSKVLAPLGVNLNAAAIRWIEANCPQAWFRPLFLPKEK